MYIPCVYTFHTFHVIHEMYIPCTTPCNRSLQMTEISFTNEISVTKYDITGKVGEL